MPGAGGDGARHDGAAWCQRHRLTDEQRRILRCNHDRRTAHDDGQYEGTHNEGKGLQLVVHGNLRGASRSDWREDCATLRAPRRSTRASRVREEVFVDRGVGADHVRNVVNGHRTRARPSSQFARALGLHQERVERGRQRGRIGGRDQHAGFIPAERRADFADIAGDDGAAGEHRLEQRERQPFGERRQREQVGRREDGRDIGREDPAGARDCRCRASARALEARLPDRRARKSPAAAVDDARPAARSRRSGARGP